MPTVSTPQTLTPSQAFWASLRGYHALKPFGGKGYPGCGPGACCRLTESTWYSRVDYSLWGERYHGAAIMDETGPLYTLGYTRTGGEQRFRAEFFGGVVQYSGSVTYNGTSYPLNSHTSQYGGRVEYDLFFNSQKHPNTLFFVGLGLRAWNRNTSGASFDSGNLSVQGFNQTWLSLYPYVGVETPHDPSRAIEFYGRARIGVTAFSYMYESFPAHDGVYPRLGGTALLEEGVRANNFSVSGYFEFFDWSQSGVSGGYLQAASNWLTIGVKAGYSF